MERMFYGFVEDNRWQQWIKNVKRFCRLFRWKRAFAVLVVAMGFFYGTFTFIAQVVEWYPQWQEERHEAWVEEQLAQYEQVWVRVEEGDTTWTIQERLTPNAHDLWDPIYLAEELNGDVNWGHLVPGQHLLMLKEK